MRIYELVYILKPDLPEEEIDGVVEQFKGFITDGGGTVEKMEKWGKRRLAYPVAKFTDGYYVLMQYSIESNMGLPKELERRLRVLDSVIKYLTVRIDEDLKRIEKLKKKREARAARKPGAAAAPKAAPSSPAPPARPAPAAATPVAAEGEPETER